MSGVNPRGTTDWDVEMPTAPGLEVETVRELLSSMRPICHACGDVMFSDDNGVRLCLSASCVAMGEEVIS